MAGIPQIKIIFDRRKKASAVTTGTVEVEVSYNRESTQNRLHKVSNISL